MRDFKKNYLIFLFIAGIFVTLIGSFSYSKFKESRSRGDLVEQSHSVLKDASHLRFLTLEALGHLTQYRETGETADKERYQKTKAQVIEVLDRIISHSANNPEQRAKSEAIRREVLAVTDLESLGSGLTDAEITAQAQVLTAIDSFVGDEDRIFEERLDTLVALNRNFYIAVVSGSFAAFALLMYMNYYLLLAQYREATIQAKFEELQEKQVQSLQATRDGIFEWKLSEQEIYWSPRVKEMVGYQDEELAASPEILEELMHPEDREMFWHDLQKHLRNEAPEHSAFFRWRHKDGRWVWIHSRGRTIFNELNEPVKLIGVHTDVTDLKEYELQLAHSRDEAEKANNAKSEFLAHMSHEIRTPLTAITGVSEILSMQKAKFDDKTQKLLSALHASSVGLRDLISDILDFSKIESGKIILEDKEFEVAELFEDITSIISVKSKEKSLTFECDYSAVSSITMLGDKSRLRQILINLVGNAVKFTQKGQVKVIAMSVVSERKEWLKVEVVDTGIGIAKEHLPYIFESFRQADASVSRKYGGTGLGLPIAKHLAQLMGGDIYASSTYGKGSCFTLYVPLRRATGDHAGVDLRADDIPAFSLKEGEKILIVEDYEGNIAFISHLMDELNIKYDLGRTGLEGLKLWCDNDYKLVLMDIQMPEMDGISAVQHIRNIEKEKELQPVPIIAMTAHAFSEDRDKCLKAGFNEYLPKPLSKHSLIETMSSLVG